MNYSPLINEIRKAEAEEFCGNDCLPQKGPPDLVVQNTVEDSQTFKTEHGHEIEYQASSILDRNRGPDEPLVSSEVDMEQATHLPSETISFLTTKNKEKMEFETKNKTETDFPFQAAHPFGTSDSLGDENELSVILEVHAGNSAGIEEGLKSPHVTHPMDTASLVGVADKFEKPATVCRSVENIGIGELAECSNLPSRLTMPDSSPFRHMGFGLVGDSTENVPNGFDAFGKKVYSELTSDLTTTVEEEGFPCGQRCFETVDDSAISPHMDPAALWQTECQGLVPNVASRLESNSDTEQRCSGFEDSHAETVHTNLVTASETDSTGQGGGTGVLHGIMAAVMAGFTCNSTDDRRPDLQASKQADPGKEAVVVPGDNIKSIMPEVIDSPQVTSMPPPMADRGKDSRHSAGCSTSRRRRRPLWINTIYSFLVVKWPCLMLLLTLSFHLATGVITVCLLLLDYDVYPLELKHLPQEVRSQKWFRREAGLRSLYPNPEISPDILAQYDEMTSYYLNGGALGLEVIIDAHGDNILDPKGLLRLKLIVSAFYTIPGIDSLLREVKNETLHVYSILNFCSFDVPGANVSQEYFRASPRDREKIKFFLTKNAEITHSTARDSVTRLILPIMDNHLTLELVNDVILPALCSAAGDWAILYIHPRLSVDQVHRDALLDMRLVIYSLVFIFFIMWLHTRSLFITLLGLLSIVGSFMGSNLLYRYVVGYRFFGHLHIAAMFIVLGIGVDDIFIFLDCWRATAKDSRNLLNRLVKTYSQAAYPMMVTSLTTAVAFACSAVSPFLGSRSFGIYSSITVAYNYLSVITFIPAVVVVHELWFGTDSCYLCLNCNNCYLRGRRTGSKEFLCTSLFRDHYFGLISQKLYAVCMILLNLIVILILACSVSNLKYGFGTRLRFYEFSHPLEKALLLKQTFQPTLLELDVTVFLVWGLKEQDMSGCDRSAIKCPGQQVDDRTFNINPVRSQIAFLKMCDSLLGVHSGSDKTMLNMKSYVDQIAKKPQIKCFMRAMQTFFQMKGWLRGHYCDFRLPWNLREVKQLYRMSKKRPWLTEPRDDYHGFMDVAVPFWLSQDPQAISYDHLILTDPQIPNDSNVTKIRPWTDIFPRITHAVIEIRTDTKVSELEIQRGILMANLMEEMVDKLREYLPPELKGVFQASNYVWPWIFLQKTLADSAIISIFVGISVAVPLLAIGTCNIVTSFLGALTILLSTISVIGMMPLFDWRLEAFSSLSISMMVGLTVDYVVHFAEAYHLSEHCTRKYRVRDAAALMGAPVLFGAISTLGATFFMFFCTIRILAQIGAFLFLTISFALYFSLTFFLPLLTLIGPEHREWDLRNCRCGR